MVLYLTNPGEAEADACSKGGSTTAFWTFQGFYYYFYLFSGVFFFFFLSWHLDSYLYLFFKKTETQGMGLDFASCSSRRVLIHSSKLLKSCSYN